MTNIGKQAPFLDGIPIVASSAERDARFPSPDTNQRVHNLETGYIERYDGATWQQEVQIVNALAQPLFNAKSAPFNAKGDGITDDTAAIQAALNAANATNNASEGAGFGGQVYLPPGVYMVSSQLVEPTQTRLVGSGRRATTIRAMNTFAFSNGTTGNVAVMRLDAFSSRVEHLSIDCNGLANSVGLWSSTINEQSGAFHVQVYGYTKYGIYVDSSLGSTPVAQTYVFDDIELTVPTTATGSKSLYINGSGAPPRLIRGITVNSSDSVTTPSSSVGFDLQGAQFHVVDCHAEHVTTGMNLGTVAAASGSIVDIFRVNNCTSGIIIGANGNGMNSYQLRGIVNSGSVTTLVNDLVRTYTNTGSFEPFYAYGAGGSPGFLSTTNAPQLATGVGVGGGNLCTKVQIYQPTLTPASVAAATVAEQTFTVSGLSTSDHVFVNPPSIGNATGIVGARVSATDTLAIRFANPTAGALTPTSGTYVVIALRF